MRFYTQFVLQFFMFFNLFIFISCLSFSQVEPNKLPIINKEKIYPMATFEPEVEITYIPLETNADVLLDNSSHIYYVSKAKMLITNEKTGDVYFFDMNGKSISQFNHKGGKGYYFISYAVYDEKSKEVFILDRIYRKIFVFTEEGTLKRTINFPYSLFISQIHNFDENSLLAYHEYETGPLIQRQPYMFISKKDGSILSKLNLTLEKANPTILYENRVTTKIGINYSGNCKFGNEFMIFNMSSDTIYELQRDKTLTPLFVQSPTVFTDPPVAVSVGMKTDKFIIFAIYPYDLRKSKRDAAKGIFYNPDDGHKYIMYEYKTGQFYQYARKNWVERTDVPKNMSVELLHAYKLIEKLKIRQLTGELKQIASKLNEEDNPVVKITRIK